MTLGDTVSIQFYNSEEFKGYIYSGDLFWIYVLALLMVVDILTGVSKAIVNQNLWSRKSLFGFIRKLMIFAMIIIANALDVILGFNGMLLYATVFFYIANELLSVLENASQLGLPVPKQLQQVLDVIYAKSENQSIADKYKNDLKGYDRINDTKDSSGVPRKQKLK